MEIKKNDDNVSKLEDEQVTTYNLSNSSVKLHYTNNKDDSPVGHVESCKNIRCFDTGAVRDNACGKGRFDLIPLDIIADLSSKCLFPYNGVIYNINAYLVHKCENLLFSALEEFIKVAYNGNLSKAMLKLALRYEMGAIHYGEDNWKKGLPNDCLLDSGLRHLFKFCDGQTDEDHASAFIWNIITLIYNERN